MSKKQKPVRPKARLPKGLIDSGADEIRGQREMLGKIRDVYESYGFEPLDTPALEYTDALGKFLPDQDRPNEGVFSLQDEDEQWLSLRYDLTAPLARYVAENFQHLPKPFRRYQAGPVWRNEKPGPGRYRQFTQFDADTVGAASVAADAEMCMLAADTLEALGLKGQYVIKVNNRKVLDGVLESMNVTDDVQKLTILRAIDKLDRLGETGVVQLLGKGRKDESGDFTKGAELSSEDIDRLGRAYRFFSRTWNKPFTVKVYRRYLAQFAKLKKSSELIDGGLEELAGIRKIVRAAGYKPDQIRIDPSVVRGLDYYTGPVFEAELTFEIKDDKGRPVRFGSVGGGGRYDDLVARFTGQKIPATGFSIGVSRLYAALRALGKLESAARPGPVVVCVFDRDAMADYQVMVQELRNADIRAELFLGNPKNMGAQFKYADQRGSPCVVIQGDDERNNPDGEKVQIKDLIEGAKAAASIESNEQWRAERPAQFAVKREKLVEAVREVIARHEDRG